MIMRNLSDILNPAPTSDVLEQNPDGPPQRRADQKGHARFGSLSSPLHALALAAEEHRTPPMNSPTSPAGASFFVTQPEHRRNSASSSHPDSNHYPIPQPPLCSPTHPMHLETMLPPRQDLSHQPTTPGVAQKPSDIAHGHAIHLPPLRRSSGEDREYAGTGHSIESYSIFTPQGNPRVEERDVRDQSDLRMSNCDEANGEWSGSPAMATPRPNEPTQPLESQKEAQVKTELTGTTPTIMNFPSPAPTGGTSSPRQGAESSHISSIKTIPVENRMTPPPMQASGALLYPPQKPMHTASGNKSHASNPTERKVEKKGTASVVKKPSRRKTDPKSKDGTPFSQRSVTPASSRASKTPALGTTRKLNSATPLHSSPPPLSVGAGQDGDDDDGTLELFCICRKPDDHTWMIACDGPCEDWFHGRCVNMDEEKGALIDKYFCPNCSAQGVGETTWKRMCRLPDCNRPVRMNKSSSSKYCSDEHGRKFMRRKIAPGDRSNSEDDDKHPAKRKKKKTSRASGPSNTFQAQFTSSADGNNEHEGDHNMSGDDRLESDHDQSHLRGGLLRPSELHALSNAVSSLSEFRRLGSPVFASTNSTDHASNSIPQTLSAVSHTISEKSQLELLSTQRASLKRRRALLDDKEKFLGLVRTRARMVLEDLKGKDKSLKDICGYDSRLSWADEEFEVWKDASGGITALEEMVSGPLNSNENPDTKVDDANGHDDPQAPSTHLLPSELRSAEVQTETMCLKKRCERHRQWFKIATQEIAFEKDSCRVEMRRLAREEKAVLERAQVRWLENGSVADKDELEVKDAEVGRDGGEPMEGIRNG